MTRRSHGLANRPGEPYPATFRIFHLRVDPPGIEPGFPVCRTGVVPLDHEPVCFEWTAWESNPGTVPGWPPTLQGSVAPNGMPARLTG